MYTTQDLTTVRSARRRYDPNDYIITADDVNAFFDRYPKTKKGALALLHRIGVRFKSNGAFSHVVSL